MTTTALSATTLLTVLVPGGTKVALAQSLTEPLDTATLGDITLEDGETLEVTNGPAVLINSDNVLVNNGSIEVTAADSAIGIQAEGGFAGGITNVGDITLVSASDDDDVPGTNKTGVLVSGAGDFTGDITFDAGSILFVEGADSTAVTVDTALFGSIVNSGTLDVDGARATGILVNAPITGSVNNELGQVTVSGEDSTAILVASDVSGSVINGGALIVDGLIDGFVDDPDTTDDDDAPMARAALAIGASVSEGIVNAGPGVDGEPGVQSLTAFLDAERSTYSLLISPTVSGGAAGDIVIGAVGDGDSAFGIVNRGSIEAESPEAGDATTAIRIEGAEIDGSTLTTAIEGGLLNENRISAITVDSAATGLSVGSGVTLPTIVNQGTITTTVLGDTGAISRSILIEEGADVSTIENQSILRTSASGTDAGSIVIEDRSGTLTLIDNQGQISPALAATATVAVPEDAVSIAIDVSQSQNDVTVLNSGEIFGEVRLGAGDDTFSVTERTFGTEDSGSTSFTDVAFLIGSLDTGAGDDAVSVTGGGVISGGISNGGGTLDLTVGDGSIVVPSTRTVNVTNASFGTESQLSFFLGEDALDTARFVATDTVTIEGDATIDVEVSSFLGEEGTFTLIDAETLLIADTVDLDKGSLPFLYNSTLAVSEADTSNLTLTIDLKTPEELGLNNNQSAAFPALIEALSFDDALAVAFNDLDSNEEIASALNQILPDTGIQTRAVAITLTDQTTASIFTRLDALRTVSHEEQSTAWFQVFGSIYTQDPVLEDFGYDGETYSVAGGFDVPWFGANAVGASFVWSGSRLSEMDSFDEDFIVDTIQLGLYGSWSFGNAFLDVQGFAGYNKYRSERVVEFDSFSEVTETDWDGYQYSGNARIGYDFIFGNTRITPVGGIDYLTLRENRSFETSVSPGIALSVDEREIESLRASGLVEIAHSFERRNGYLTPSIRAGYRQEFETDPLVTTVQFNDGTIPFDIVSAEIQEGGFTGGFGVSFSNKALVFELGYDALIEEDFIRHSGGLNFRFLFGR